MSEYDNETLAIEIVFFLFKLAKLFCLSRTKAQIRIRGMRHTTVQRSQHNRLSIITSNKLLFYLFILELALIGTSTTQIG